MTHPILYIEDDIQQIELVELVLSREGFEVMTSKDGGTGLALAQQYLPLLVLIDINLPVMNGIEVAQHLRHAPETASIPLIALTSSMKLGTLEQYVGTLFNAYLPKPFHRHELIALIREYTGEISR
jgi:CheY-like chemotaxis protein